MKKSHKIIAVFCAISLIISGFVFSVNSTAEEQSNLSVDLLSRLEIISEEAEIPVAVWTYDIDYDEDEIVAQARTNVDVIKASAYESTASAEKMNYQS